MSLRVSANPLSVKDVFRQVKCERDHLYFSRYFFKERQSNLFRVNWHHKIISDALQGVIDGKIKNLFINVPPGSSKTELAVINFIARGLALNPRARFLHLSYSDDLALLNSQTARDLLRSDEFQHMWPMEIAEDAKSKKRWNVVVDGKTAGGVYATSLAGQITGFRAGHMKEGFQGAIIIDDPMKPEDAFSDLKCDRANRQLLTTVKSRKANPDTPIVCIMQRVGEMDCTGFAKAGGLGGDITYITIPAVIDEAYIAANIPEELQAEVIRDAKDRFSYWPYKERIKDLLEMEAGQGSDATGVKISKHVFSSQYQQAPRAVGGNLIKGAWFPRYTRLPKIKYRKMYADTAQKIKKRNDYSVFAVYGLGDDDKLYLIDQIRGKWEAPELEARAKAFWAKHLAADPKLEWVEDHPLDKGWMGQLRKMIIEDKSSGTGLIQKIKSENRIPVGDIQRDNDKLTRCMDAQGYLEQSMVYVPTTAPFTSDFIDECEAFTADDSHAHDDQLDCLFDAVKDMLSNNKLEKWKNII